nr:WAS/WASL-interacting protein family member 2-like [Aegilops tauschii subsp. strangulata]
MGQPATVLEASAVTGRLIIAAVAGAFAGGGAAAAGRAAAITESELALVLVVAVTKAKHFATVVVFRVGVRRSLSFANRLTITPRLPWLTLVEPVLSAGPPSLLVSPAGGPPCRSPSPATNAATGPAGHGKQASSLHPCVRRDGRTAAPSPTPAGSSSHARRGPADAQAALLMAHHLLRYSPVNDFYQDWLDHITELVSGAGGSPAPSLSLPHPPPAAGDVVHGAPPPPPRQDIALGPRHAAPRRDTPRRAATREESFQEVQRPHEDAPVLPAPPRQDRAPHTVVARGPQD